jgi:hypothetical protein
VKQNGFKMKRLTPLKIIRAHCLECGNGNYKKVKECRIKYCLFYFFRFGTNPARKGIGGGIDNLKTQETSKISPKNEDLSKVSISDGSNNFKQPIAHSSGHKNSKKGIVEAVGNPKSHD